LNYNSNNNSNNVSNENTNNNNDNTHTTATRNIMNTAIRSTHFDACVTSDARGSINASPTVQRYTFVRLIKVVSLLFSVCVVAALLLHSDTIATLPWSLAPVLATLAERLAHHILPWLVALSGTWLILKCYISLPAALVIMLACTAAALFLPMSAIAALPWPLAPAIMFFHEKTGDFAALLSVGLDADTGWGG